MCAASFKKKIVEIDDRIHQLENLKNQLQLLIKEADLREQLDADYCPIIEHAHE